MKTARPRSSRRRPRRGSVERPVNTRLVRSALLVLLPPLLLLAFTIGRPGPLPAPALPPSFDGAAATALATELARENPNRKPGSVGAAGAVRWFEEKLALYGLPATEDAWKETIPGLGRVELRNAFAVVRGTTEDAIVIVAHRDNDGGGPGANDNASGTAALIELARGYARLGTAASRPTPRHTLVFLSSDGGAYGGFGAARFARTSPFRGRVLAVVSLDGLAGSARPRLEISAAAPRSPAPALLRTADVRITSQLGRAPARPGWLAQLVDLAVPFGYGEQAPFLGERISAVRIATPGDAGVTPARDVPERLDAARFGQLGRAVEGLLASLDAGIELAGGTAGYLYLGDRIVRGWAIELVLLAALLPYLIGTVDLLARCRRRGLPLRGAWRALRARAGLWLWVALLIGIGALFGVFPRDSPIPPPPSSPAVAEWPALGLAVLGALGATGWWRVRRRLSASAPVTADEVLAGYAVALTALAGIALLTALVSPYGLVFVLPSLYAWLWLPQCGHGRRRGALFALGLAGPVLALATISAQLGLGPTAPLYLTALVTLGFVPWAATLALFLWAAVAMQLGSLVARGSGKESQSGR